MSRLQGADGPTTVCPFSLGAAAPALSTVLGIEARQARLKRRFAGLGRWGPVAFVVIYVAATVAALTGSVLVVTAGVLFATILGAVLVSIGAPEWASARGAPERRVPRVVMAVL